MIKIIFLILIIPLLLLNACSQDTTPFVTKTIENALGEEVNNDDLIHISYPEQDIAIYQDYEKIYFCVLRDKKTVYAGYYRKDEIFDGKNNSFNWSSFSDNNENIYGLWGLVLNSERGHIILNEEPINPSFIDLGTVSIYYKFFEDPLDLSINVENKIIE
ncbi:hypothetical protein [Alkaliphilus peptidifermentans]|uniref:Uncharacterized protein n=1 Tax=Alkaliphilus peptidifermentans DSM 18978 TaxID=1120976 RepID=A0A1G5FDJ4_9FIRM|nr:hypothetical protein [Alkaliphilus peptidifermentans]SCY37342.1 hypothetical protein SAMN03080606_01384 [Alkaliphilus peptidifermentans DSM 18978]